MASSTLPPESRPRLDTLATELLQLILDEVHKTSPSTTYALTLVSHRLNQISQAYLYRDITLYVGNIPSSQGGRKQQRLEQMLKKDAVLAEYVKVLRVVEAEAGSDHGSAKATESILEVLPQLRNLRDVHLQTPTYAPILLQSLTILPRHKPNLHIPSIPPELIPHLRNASLNLSSASFEPTHSLRASQGLYAVLAAHARSLRKLEVEAHSECWPALYLSSGISFGGLEEFRFRGAWRTAADNMLEVGLELGEAEAEGVEEEEIQGEVDGWVDSVPWRNLKTLDVPIELWNVLQRKILRLRDAAKTQTNENEGMMMQGLEQLVLDGTDSDTNASLDPDSQANQEEEAAASNHNHLLIRGCPTLKELKLQGFQPANSLAILSGIAFGVPMLGLEKLKIVGGKPLSLSELEVLRKQVQLGRQGKGLGSVTEVEIELANDDEEEKSEGKEQEEIVDVVKGVFPAMKVLTMNFVVAPVAIGGGRRWKLLQKEQRGRTVVVAL